jgi:hypothetical protein
MFNIYGSLLIFNDVGMELPADETFEINDDEHFDDVIKTEIKDAYFLGRVTFSNVITNIPPLVQDQINPFDESTPIGNRFFDCGDFDDNYVLGQSIECGNPFAIYTASQFIDCGQIGA